jgi:flagellin
MPLGVLNNISAVYAENNLNQTQSSLQNVLTQLSSGSKINSGADDPAGLSIANGLAANSAALSQSSSNASEGAGFLQVADGALSQVTSLLTSAVTLATEAGGGTLSGSQLGAANQEYQDILTQIGTIGSTTEYNGITVFSADQTTSALGWGANAAGALSSVTGSSGTVAAGSITAGGSTAAAAPAETTTYSASPVNMSWTANGTAATSTLTSSVIANGAQLSGTLAFSPTTSGGTASAISINLANVTGSSLTAQAASLQTLINAQAGNGDSDYTVTAVGNNQLQIGLGTNASADHITGFTGAPATGASTGGAAAAQTGFNLAVTDGGTLGGSISVQANSAVAAGAQTNVSFTNNGATITANLPSADNIGGTIVIGGTIPQSGGVATPLSWSNNGAGATETFSAAVDTTDNTLTGSFTIAGTGDANGPYTIDLSSLAGEDQAQIQTTIGGVISGAGGTASDYSITYSAGTLTIGLSGGGSETGIAVANTGGSAATQTTPVVPASTSPNKTIDLDNVTTANLQSTLTADLAGSDYSATYNSGTGALSFGISGAGTGAGVTALTISGSPTVFKQTPASTSAGANENIPLTNVTTANLASAVSAVLNAGKTLTGPDANADYAVTYSNGTLNVALTSYATTTDKITNLTLASTATETTPTSGSIAFTNGEQLSGQFTITPTVSGVAGSAVTVNLNGQTASSALVATVNAALNAATPNSSADYSVAYNVNNQTGVGTLSIGPSAAGLLANVDSVSIANGTLTNAMGESGVAVTNINSANTVMGNFTVTPTTAAGAGTAVNVDLDGVSNANLLSTVQSALGSNYTVAYDTTKTDANVGNLSISVSSTGAAAGITSFTVAEATSQAASQETPVAGGVSVYTSDGTLAGSQNYNVTVGSLTDASVGTSAAASATSLMGTQVTTNVGGVVGTGGVLSGAGAGTSLTGTNLSSQANAEAALQTVDNAINAVAYQRGQVGANINTLTAASNIASSQMTNITSAQNTITATDYASATSNMSKFEILTQTGISALAQANSTQQMVTKLLQ